MLLSICLPPTPGVLILWAIKQQSRVSESRHTSDGGPEISCLIRYHSGHRVKRKWMAEDAIHLRAPGVALADWALQPPDKRRRALT